MRTIFVLIVTLIVLILSIVDFACAYQSETSQRSERERVAFEESEANLRGGVFPDESASAKISHLLHSIGPRPTALQPPPHYV